MNENTVGSALNEPEKKVESGLAPRPSLPESSKAVGRAEEPVLVDPNASDSEPEVPKSLLGRAIDRVKGIAFITYIALIFAALTAWLGSWFAFFWVTVALAVELKMWDDFKTKVKVGLSSQGRPKTAAAWGKFASKTGATIG